MLFVFYNPIKVSLVSAVSAETNPFELDLLRNLHTFAVLQTLPVCPTVYIKQSQAVAVSLPFFNMLVAAFESLS